MNRKHKRCTDPVGVKIPLPRTRKTKKSVKAVFLFARFYSMHEDCFFKLSTFSFSLYTSCMLYTRAGDKGTTKTFACDQRISKSSAVAEALGSLDETNSFLGFCKVHPKAKNYKLQTKNFSDIVHEVQQNLFIVQAELAGAPKTITKEKVKEVEKLVDAIEKELPPIKTFFISGGTELATA